MMMTLKRSELAFVEGFTTTRAMNNNPTKALDWDKASEIIKKTYKKHPDLIVEAGLQGDWAYTGGVIFRNGNPVVDEYTFLASKWAIPCLIFIYDGEEQEAIDCFEEEERFNSDSKWPESALQILRS
jgi:hypothetical protein